MQQQKNRSGRIKKIMILAAILALPGFLYYLLKEKGENRYKPLPIYGEKTLAGTFRSRMGRKIPDTLYHQVPPFTLLNQDGSTVHVPEQDTSIAVVNFFYTRCQGFCGHMNDEMDRVATRFANNRMVRFYTLTVDGAHDTPDILAQYVKHYRPGEKKWDFLTGDPDSLFRIAREGFLVNAIRDTTREAAFIHSSSLVLLDSQRRIRGYYDVNMRGEVDKLIDEIKLLLTEEIRNISRI